MKLAFLFFSILSIFIGFSQTGPGGVGNSSSNAFWIDANELNYSNGDNVSLLNDYSGNNNSFSQFTSTKQPMYITNVVNGLPVIRFDGVSDDLLSSNIPNLESPNVTWFIVYKQQTQKTCCLIGSNYDSQSKKWYSYSLVGGQVRHAHYSPTITITEYMDDYSSFNFTSTHITPSSLTTYKEGNLIQSKTVPYTTPTGHNFVVLGSFPTQNTNNKYLDGDIAEVFVFNTALNNLERVIIENYIGAKYGSVIPEDYYSFEGTHNIGVIGIGNDGVDSHINSEGNGVLSLSNPVGLSSNEYMFLGHDNTDLSLVENTDMPASISTHSRLSRTWRVDETGELGNLTLKFDVSGTAGFADPATYNLLVDTDGDFSNSTVISGIYNAGTQEMQFTLDLSVGDYITLSGIPVVPVAIHSITSGDWSNIATWDCSCIPTSSDTVYIDNSDGVLVDINASAYNIIVENNATLKMSLNFQLSIFGDLTVDGTMASPNGTVGFVGSTAQNISLNGNVVDFNNILINNIGIGNVTFSNGTYILNNTLTPTNGVMVVDNAGGGDFIINSVSATTSGRVGVINPTCSLLGDFTVRRFLPPGVAANRTIATPVSGANLSMWDNDIYISGAGFPDGCAYSADGCYFSCRTFSGGDFADDYNDVTNPNETLISGTGYELFIGDDLNVFSGATISSKGTLRDFNDISIVYPQIKQGWNIVGNPYASPFLFSSIVTSHMGNYFYIYDAASGAYQWYDGASNTSSTAELANGIISTGQGFWIVGGGVPSMNLKQSYKTSNTATFIRTSQVDESIYLTMSEEGTTYKCIVNVDFNERALDSHDSLDIMHLSTGLEKASSLMINSNGGMLRKQYLYNDSRDKTLDMSINILNEGYFTIDASNLDNLQRYSNVTLIDNSTGDVVNLKKMSSYTFYAYEGESQRFQLVLSNRTVEDNNTSIFESSATGDELSITQIGNSINIESEETLEGITEVNIFNLLGQEVIFSKSLEIQAGSNMVFLPSELSGMYLIVIKSINGVQTKKIML